jgi:aspartyl-tRNA(Asn)/glutamyl-tRNA(Gln) amidotransferase subunit A
LADISAALGSKIKMNGAWATASLKNLGDEIANGSIDPLELTNHFLTRINEEPERDKIFTLVIADSARKQAMESGRRAKVGRRLSPYDGIPIVWKDNFDIQGFPTSAGVPMLAKNTATHDCAAVKLASRVGLIHLAKTNMTELAFSGLGINAGYGTPSNPFDSKTARIPGGSSSGSAVAVAKGLCAAAIGTDTSGSVRIPSAWNGLVGLKMTGGRVPMDGVAPLSRTLDSFGLLTRMVEDSAALHRIFTGEEVDLTGATVAGKKFFVPQNIVWDGIDPEVDAIVRGAIENISTTGASVSWGPVPEFDAVFDSANKYGHIVNYEGYRDWGKFLEENPNSIPPQILNRFRIGRDTPEENIRRVYEVLREQGECYRKRMALYDAVLMPTVASVPPAITELERDAEAYTRENMMALRNTRLANFLGVCAITIPAGFTRSGLPVGLMAMGSAFGEAELLKVAAGMERLARQ